jgi:hypothetical protein
MNKVIVYKNQDGTCSIIVPAPEMFDKNSRTRQALAAKGITFSSDEEVLNWIRLKDVPPGLESRITDTGNIPADRNFRAAWTDANPTETVDIDMPKARSFHMQKIREARNQKLDKLDIEHRKASGNQAKQAEIDAKAQELRDLPANVNLDVAATPEALKAIWPVQLA